MASHFEFLFDPIQIFSDKLALNMLLFDILFEIIDNVVYFHDVLKFQDKFNLKYN
jgi:hypothetical protein